MHDGAVTYRLAVCATRRAFAARPSVAVLAIVEVPRRAAAFIFNGATARDLLACSS